MNFQFYLEKLGDSKVFQEFMKKNPKAYLCSAFFTVDKVGNDNQRHIDLYVLKSKKMFNFKFNSDSKGGIDLVPVEKSSIVPEPLKKDTDFEMNDVEELITKRMQKEKINNKLQKILISIQSLKGKPALICTVFMSGLGLLRVNIDVKSMKIVLFEKKSFFDIIRRVK